MASLLKKLFVLALILGALSVMSYAGARARAGMILGSDLPDLGPIEVGFAFGGVTELPEKPLAWVMAYNQTSLRGLPAFRIYVSPLGKVLGTQPADLESRLEPYRRQLP